MSLYYSQFLLDTAFLSVLIELDKVPLDLDSEPLVLPSLDIGSTCQVTSHLLRWHLAGIGFLLKGTPSSLPILLMLSLPRNLSCLGLHFSSKGDLTRKASSQDTSGFLQVALASSRSSQRLEPQLTRDF